jgi:hypothetical protein
MRQVWIAMKRGLRIAQHTGRLRNNGWLLWLQYMYRLAGSWLRCGRLLHRRFLIGNLWCWCSMCFQRCLGPPFALHRLGICFFGFRWLTWLPGLFLFFFFFFFLLFFFRLRYNNRFLSLRLWARLLTRLSRCCEPSRRWRSRVCRGGRAKMSNTNTTRRYADRGRRRALLRRVRRRAQTSRRGCIVCVHSDGHGNRQNPERPLVTQIFAIQTVCRNSRNSKQN